MVGYVFFCLNLPLLIGEMLYNSEVVIEYALGKFKPEQNNADQINRFLLRKKI